MPLVDRAYRDTADLEAMQGLVSRSWLERRPLVNCTFGDLDWWTVNDPEYDPLVVVRLWYDDSELVGWTWGKPPGGLDWHAIRTATVEVLSPALDQFEAGASAGADGVAATTAWPRTPTTRPRRCLATVVTRPTATPSITGSDRCPAAADQPSRNRHCRPATGGLRLAGRWISRHASRSTVRHSRRLE